MSEPFLVASGLVKRYPGVLALDHAHLEIAPGVITGLLGKP
jgi:ABC-type sugar transport system ATPase subunit